MGSQSHVIYGVTLSGISVLPSTAHSCLALASSFKMIS
jgi:hypothetical protein